MAMKPLKVLNHSWPAITWSVIIFIMLTLPASSLPSESKFPVPNFDKLVHFGLFGGFVYLWIRYLSARFPGWSFSRVIILFFLLSSIYGIGMEYFQRYVLVDRHFDYYDILADVLGAFAGMLLCFRWFGKKGKAGAESQTDLKIRQ